MMAVGLVLLKDEKGKELVQHHTRARKHQAWPAVEERSVELAMRGPPQEAHLFLCQELVTMEPVSVHQEIVRMCSRLP